MGTQERVSAAFLFDSYEVRDCFLIRPALCTRLVIETRIPLKYLILVIRMLLKLTVKKRVFKSKIFAMPPYYDDIR